MFFQLSGFLNDNAEENEALCPDSLHPLWYASEFRLPNTKMSRGYIVLLGRWPASGVEKIGRFVRQ